MAAGRGREAVGWLGHNIEIKPNGALVIRAMHAAANSDECAKGNDAAMLQHWVGVLLDYRSSDPKSASRRSLSLSGSTSRPCVTRTGPPPRTLHRAVARDPEFFAYLLKLIYLPRCG